MYYPEFFVKVTLPGSSWGVKDIERKRWVSIRLLFILFFQDPRTQRLRHPLLFPSLDYSEKRPRPSLEARNSWLVRSCSVAGSCPLSLSKIRSSEFLKYHVSSRSTTTTRRSRSFDFSRTFQSYFATRRLRRILRASVLGLHRICILTCIPAVA